MISVFLFTHYGVRAAVPASQAVAVGPGAQSVTTTALWPGTQGDEGSRTVVLRANTSSTQLSLLCEEVQLAEVPRASLTPLSPCLRGALGRLPHVVGVLWLQSVAVWLVDISRLDPSAHPE